MQGIGIVFGCDAARFIAKHSGCKKERLKINSAGYVTNNNRKRDRKEAQKGLNKKL